MRRSVGIINRFSLTRRLSSTIQSSNLEITQSTNLKTKTPLEQLTFGTTFSDHMLEIDWSQSKGWTNPQIIPYGNFSISPASTVFHYGIECFEGMKAYKDSNGKIRLFRPDRNMARLNYSMQKLGMPSIGDGSEFMECLKKLLLVDESWIPDKEGYSIYIRPTAIGTSAFLGVLASDAIKLFAILSPVGPYYKAGFVPIKLFADTVNVRAWPGGAGNAKVGGNYAPTIEPSRAASKKYGTAQNLWLYGPNHEVTEVGAMNIFFVLKSKDSNKLELVTPPLTRGDILPGVTRLSIIELAKQWTDELVVSERFLTMAEVIEARKEDRLLEVFGAGTAVVISPVKSIIYNDQEIVVPTGDDAGPIAAKLWKTLYDIQYGKVEHEWSQVIS